MRDSSHSDKSSEWRHILFENELETVKVNPKIVRIARSLSPLNCYFLQKILFRRNLILSQSAFLHIFHLLYLLAHSELIYKIS